MSAISKISNQKGAAPKRFKKFCAFCKAKGLPESVFTSHFVKDQPGPDGKVCCPELLKEVCRDCGCAGHTPKFCPAKPDTCECGYCHEKGHRLNLWVDGKRQVTCPKLLSRDVRRAAATKRAAGVAKGGFQQVGRNRQQQFGRNRQQQVRGAAGNAPAKTSNMFEALTGYETPQKPKEDFPALPSTRKQSHKVAPQGVWGGVAGLSIAQLEQILTEKRAAVEKPSIDEEMAKQTLEETVVGEALLDNEVLTSCLVEEMHAEDELDAAAKQAPLLDPARDFAEDADGASDDEGSTGWGDRC
jgi:hypothetical protein